MYWDIGKLLTYNRLFNFVVGARGCGKTYAFKRWAIKDFLKSGNQFVYIRRYRSEFEGIKNFFDDICKEFNEHEFEVEGDCFLIDKKIAGYSIPLSTAYKQKSTPYPNVNKICFDEFIISGNNHYLKNECVQFFELYSTIARTRDVRAIFLSNAMSIYNPYFVYFDIELDKKGFYKFGKEILVEYIESEEFKNFVMDTKFYTLLEHSEYMSYALDNDFAFDKSYFISKKTGTCRHVFNILIDGKTIGVWNDPKTTLSYLSWDYDKSCDINFCVFDADHNPNSKLLDKGNMIKTYLIPHYKRGGVRFESDLLKSYFNMILKAAG